LATSNPDDAKIKSKQTKQSLQTTRVQTTIQHLKSSLFYCKTKGKMAKKSKQVIKEEEPDAMETSQVEEKSDKSSYE
jgi:hypothetical protein